MSMKPHPIRVTRRYANEPLPPIPANRSRSLFINWEFMDMANWRMKPNGGGGGGRGGGGGDLIDLSLKNRLKE